MDIKLVLSRVYSSFQKYIPIEKPFLFSIVMCDLGQFTGWPVFCVLPANLTTVKRVNPCNNAMVCSFVADCSIGTYL
jgi:hypothetical protein